MGVFFSISGQPVQANSFSVGDITISATDTTSPLVTSAWDEATLTGTANVGAAVNWGTTRVTSGALMNVSDNYSLKASENLINQGGFNAQALTPLSVLGDFYTTNGGTSVFSNLTIGSGGGNTVQTGGTESGTNLTISSGGTQTVQSGAASEWSVVEISGVVNVAAAVEWEKTNITSTGTLNASGSYAVAEDQEISNAGTLNASTLPSLSMSGKLTTESGGTGLYKELVLENGATATTKTGGADSGEKLKIEARASYTAETGANLNFDNVEIAVSGTLNNNGTLVANEVTVGGTVTGTGTISNSANGKVTVEAGAALTQQTVDVKTFTNKGATTLGDVSNFGADHTLIMSGNTSQITITNGSWFSNTNLVYEKGAVVAASDLNAAGEFGANTVKIRGDANPVITSGKPNTATFAGMTTVSVNKLKAETDVTIEAGGRLIVNSLDTNGVNATLNGGVIEVDSSDLLTPSDEYVALLLNATDPSGAFSGNSSIIHNVYGYVYDGSALSGITLNSGVVSLTSASPMQQPLIMTIARGIGNVVTTVFNGDVIPSTTAAGTITPEQVAAFFVEQSTTAQIPVLSPGIVLSQYQITGTDESAPITFGSEGDVRRSIGFASVRNASGVVINDGLELALIGTEALSAESTINFDDAGTMLVGNATVNNGTFTVGSQATYDLHTGWINTLNVSTEDGKARFKNGIWGVKNGFTSAGALEININASVAFAKTSTFRLADTSSETVSNIAGAVVIERDGDSPDIYLGRGHTINISGVFSSGDRNTQSAAKVNLSGAADFGKLELKNGAEHKVTATGIETGSELTQENGAKITIANGGQSSWDKVTLNGSAQVSGVVDWTETNIGITGRLAVLDGYALSDTQTLRNEGLFDATGVNLTVYGDIETKTFGTSRFGNMTLKAGATNTVQEGGAERCGTLTVEEGATQTVAKGAVSQWNVVNLSGNAYIAANTSWKETNIKPTGFLMTSQDFAIDSGESVRIEGLFDTTSIATLASAGKVVTAGGTAHYQNLTLDSGAQHELQSGVETGKTLSIKQGASYSMRSAADDASAVWETLVMDGGSAAIRLSNLTLGSMTLNSGYLTILPNSATSAVDPGTARLTIDNSVPLNVNDTALQVGSLSSGDSAPSAGDVYFGADSILDINAKVLSTTQSSIHGNSAGSITVKKGSMLNVSGATWGKHYLVADSFGKVKMDKGAWNSDDVVTDTGDNAYTSVMNNSIVLHVGNDEGDTSIRALSENYIAPGLIDSLINNLENLSLRDANSDSADIAFIERMLDKDYAGSTSDGKLDTAASSQALNSAMAISAASGIDAYASQTTFNQMERLSAIMSGSDYATRRRRPDDAIWAKLIGNQSKTTKLAFGNGSAGFKATEYGLMIGGDWAMDRRNRIGAAAHYIKADLKSKGGVSSTKTDAKNFGVTLYGIHDIGRIRLTGQFGYGSTKGTIKQNFTDRKKNSYSIKGSSQAKTISAGVRAEAVLPAVWLDIVPHVGINVSYTKHKAVKTTINGKNAFSGKTKDTYLAQVPVGVTLKSVIKTRRGVTIQPHADFTIAPQFGKKKAKATVSAVGFNGSDGYSYGIAENKVSRLTAGVNITSREHELSVNITSEKGGSGRSALGVMARYKNSF